MKRTAKEIISARNRGALKMRDLGNKAYDFYLATDPLTVFAWNDGTFSVVGLINEDFNPDYRKQTLLNEDKIVFADEMDRVLNPILSDRGIAFINGMEHKGQFIFSTHNVLHLNLKTYMKEQIYFITKSKDNLTSELYSLSDFPEVRYETTKVYEFYMKGILGGTAFE